MSTHPADATNLNAQAGALLKSADELRAQSHAALQTTQQLLLRMQTTKRIEAAVADIMSKQGFVREVDALFDAQQKTLHEYEIAFERLKAKKLHPALRHIAPQEDDSLAAWANIQDLSKLGAEAVQELDELQNLSSWMRNSAEKTNSKYAELATQAAQIQAALTTDQLATLEASAMQDITLHSSSIEDTYNIIKMQHDRIVAGQSSSGLLSSSPSSSLLLQQGVEIMRDRIQQLQNRLFKITALQNDVQDRFAKLSAMHSQSSTMNSKLLLFQSECDGVSKEIDFLRKEFQDYKANVPDNVFAVLRTSTDAWTRFCHAYDEMLLELSRRRQQLIQAQQIAEAYQRELDMIFQHEQTERKRFEEAYRADFPQSWWTLVPGLLEPAVRHVIHPDRITTSLPDVGPPPAAGYSPPESTAGLTTSSTAPAAASTSPTAQPHQPVIVEDLAQSAIHAGLPDLRALDISGGTMFHSAKGDLQENSLLQASAQQQPSLSNSVVGMQPLSK